MLLSVSLTRYPWLKGHGPIEGQWLTDVAHGTRLYPWLKGHGPIEGCCLR